MPFAVISHEIKRVSRVVFGFAHLVISDNRAVFYDYRTAKVKFASVARAKRRQIKRGSQRETVVV